MTSHLCGHYRDDDSPAARCLALVARCAPAYMSADPLRDYEGRAYRRKYRPRSTPAEQVALAATVRAHPGQPLHALAAALGVPDHLLSYAARKFGVRVRVPRRRAQATEVAA